MGQLMSFHFLLLFCGGFLLVHLSTQTAAAAAAAADAPSEETEGLERLKAWFAEEEAREQSDEAERAKLGAVGAKTISRQSPPPKALYEIRVPQLLYCEPGRCNPPTRATGSTAPGAAHINIMMEFTFQPPVGSVLEVFLPNELLFARPPRFQILTSINEELQHPKEALLFSNNPAEPNLLRLPITSRVPKGWLVHFLVTSAILPKKCMPEPYEYDLYGPSGDLLASTRGQKHGVFLHNIPYYIACVPWIEDSAGAKKEVLSTYTPEEDTKGFEELDSNPDEIDDDTFAQIFRLEEDPSLFSGTSDGGVNNDFFHGGDGEPPALSLKDFREINATNDEANNNVRVPSGAAAEPVIDGVEPASPEGLSEEARRRIEKLMSADEENDEL